MRIWKEKKHFLPFFSFQIRKSGDATRAAGCRFAQIAASSASPPEISQVPRPVSSWKTFTVPSSTYIA